MFSRNIKARPEIPVSNYQSFEPGKGSSDSVGKLAALMLPDLTGKRFLDLGCNHGFFCFAALERGAASVVGVDRDPESIAAATARASALGVSDRATFVHASWDSFDQGGFDVAVLMSALHYAPDQAALLRKIAGLLNSDGMLILEGGIIENRKRPWTSIIRGTPPHTDIVEYPTHTVMMEMLADCYAPRQIGPSVTQPGDNVPRYVWHCPRRKRTVLALSAKSKTGKSTLAKSLGVPVIDIDILLAGEAGKDTPLGRLITPVFQLGHLNRSLEKIEADGLQSELAELVLNAIEAVPSEEPTVAVMGMSMTFPSFAERFRSRAADRNMILWEAQRSV
jgi:2-polyprenyl-3-methyl-5-hydroxy-6-metoxy-1,4-benzoquinol methylase